MLVREILQTDAERFDAAATHPLQTWSWGEFRKACGKHIRRVGVFDGETLRLGIQASFHPLPIGGYSVGYFPRGPLPTEDQLSVVHALAREENALFIKIEPNVALPVADTPDYSALDTFLKSEGGQTGRPFFATYTFQIDLTQTENQLFDNLESKTRYNVRLAKKKGVEIIENTSSEGMQTYIEILKETTRRNAFYAHTPEYFQTMWQTVGSSKMMRIFEARYEGDVLASWIMFLHNGVLYYPYGASRSIHRNVMASNLLLWEMILYGKKSGATLFDLWGSLGPDADQSDRWYGFHKFKSGYGGTLMRFLGSYDIVENQPFYGVFRTAEKWRWRYLRTRANLGI